LNLSSKEIELSKTTAEQNRALVLNASFNTLFNKRDYETAKQFWSDRYIQHSAHIPAGRNGLFDLVRALPDTLRYENQLIVAEGDYVIAHGRFSGHGRPAAWIAADIVRVEDGRLAEHWDVLQDEATEAVSRTGCQCLVTAFPADKLMPADQPQANDRSFSLKASGSVANHASSLPGGGNTRPNSAMFSGGISER
jgi:predicted SnoaL-like aldol condensation-catalyzing enzyme